MFGYGIEEGNYVAAPSLFRHRTGMKIYQYRNGKYYAVLENALRYIRETGESVSWPHRIVGHRGTTQLRIDRTINLTRFNPWDVDLVE